MKNKLKSFFRWLWTYLKPFTNWRFLICFGLAWMLTNGIWYPIAGMIPAGVVPIPIIPHPFPWIPLWLVNFARAYIIFLFLPFTPEKLVTIPIAIWLLTKMFKNHPKTRAQLDTLYTQAKEDWAKVKAKFKRNKKKGEKKEMEDYKVRFINEHKELKERHGKLTTMIEKHHAGTLHFTPTCPIELLERQRDIMAEYLLVLEERAKIEDIAI